MLTDDVTTRRSDGLTPTHWRLGGGLLLAYVVMMFAGLTQEVSPVHGDSADKIKTLFAGASFDRVIAGGFVESLSFVVLLPALVFLSRAFGRRTEEGRWASLSALAAGVSYVAVTLAVGMPSGAAAMYAAQHGADATTVMAVVDLRNYAFFVSVLLSGAQAIALGIAALSDGQHRRWIGFGGVAAGVVSIAAVGAGAPNLASMVWLVWFVGVGVTLLRHSARSTEVVMPPATTS